MKRYKSTLIIIVISQFCCASLWFASNGVMANLIIDFELGSEALGHLTSLVQSDIVLLSISYVIMYSN